MEDRDIHILYYNQSGIGFLWNNIPTKSKIQLVFRDMNLEFEKPELELFRELISNTITHYSGCKKCENPDHCQNILLLTPLTGLSLILSTKELESIKDLIEGVIFNLNLENLLDDLIL
ncbi:hypothetical protein MKO06_04975 [Gramella sp. GC03-9]|uniref:Uncharacterized protein n=1 Tax=Christiangramia oceanisediminis TaxID=2920386 RepID=A0A9X2I108_9FLAO|nr:DUF6686 family protein [Gramella oceanisediminis]MCP9199249.1 hypothetical protein [Gramella oceanisediminis]